MESIKIIKKFYGKKDALKAASYFKKQYKQLGKKVTIEIIEAYNVHGSIKKSIGSPRPNDYIIFIKQQTIPVVKKVVQKVKAGIKKTRKIISKVFKSLTKTQPKPTMIVATPYYNKTVHLKPTNVSHGPTIIAPISLYNRHTA